MILHLLAAGALVAAAGRVDDWRARRRGRRPTPPDPPAVPPAPPEPAAPPRADDAERARLDRALAVSASGAALAMGGALGAAALTPIAVPVLVVASAPVLGRAWHDLVVARTVSFQILLGASTLMVLASGSFVALGLGVTVAAAGQRARHLTRRSARANLESAFAAWSETAVVCRGGEPVEVPLAEVAAGEVIIVSAGRPVPVDGVVTQGAIAVDARAFTGESRLLDRVAGDAVRASTQVVVGRARVRVERAGAETEAARLQALVQATDSYEQAVTQRSEAVVDATVRPTLALAAGAWLVRGPLAAVGCVWGNCADLLWVAAPTSVLHTMDAAARAGLLVKDGRTLDLLEEIDTVVFDKTGTLTLDRFEVVAIDAPGPLDADAILRLAAAAERDQSHPIGKAITAEADRRGLDHRRLTVRRPEVRAGLGLASTVDGRAVLLGSARLLDAAGVAPPTADGARGERGQTVVHIAVDGAHAGTIALRPMIRPEARDVVEALSRRGLDVMILTGDDEAPTRHLAEALGIGTWFSRTLPDEKDARIAALQAEGRRVCFVGDGINDALAMNRARVSVSLAGASSLAVDTAQVVLGDGSLSRVDDLFSLARRHRAVQRRLTVAAAVPSVFGVGGALVFGLPLTAIIGGYWVGMMASAGIIFGQRPILADGHREAAAPARAGGASITGRSTSPQDGG